MLIMPVQRVAILLEQAAAIDSDALEVAGAPDSASGGLDEVLADSPDYHDLWEALQALTPQEVPELRALAAIGESDDPESEWDWALEQAQQVGAEEALGRLARILILTDAVESGLDRLGYDVDLDLDFDEEAEVEELEEAEERGEDERAGLDEADEEDEVEGKEEE